MGTIIKQKPVSFIGAVKSIGDHFLGKMCATISERRSTMNSILRRDITGECFGECRNTVREGEVRRQAMINKIVKESEAKRHAAKDTRSVASR